MPPLSNVEQYHCRSLFEKDKLLFAFLLATRVMRQRKLLPSTEYEYLTTGGAAALGKAGVWAVADFDVSGCTSCL